jgi:aminopeptidase N
MRSEFQPDWEQLGINACYDLTLRIQDHTPAFSGSGKLTFTNLSGAEIKELVLRIYPNAPVLFGGSLELTQAKIDGNKVVPQVFLKDRSAVRLPLAKPLKDGDSLVAELEFQGEVPQDYGSDAVYGTFNLSSSPVVMTLSNWFPILAEWQDGQWQAEPVEEQGDPVVSQVALYRVEIQSPTDWKVAASGTRIQYKQTDEENKELFVTGPVRDFMVVASPALEMQTTKYEDVRVVHWGLPDTKSAWDEALKVAAGSLDLFSRDFGPYPYNELDVVSVPMQNASGVEYPTLVLIKDTLYSGSDRVRSFPTVIAHEVAHQWWYAMVGNDVLENPWQDEALATYSSFAYLEKNYPPVLSGTMDYFVQRVNDYELEQGKSNFTQPVSAYLADPSSYSILVYDKGCLFLWDLRQKLGEDVFNRGLQAYYTQGQYRSPEPGKLVSSFEKACNCDLSEFYTEWKVED